MASEMFVNNSAQTMIESWFIPLDILSIICNVLVIGLATLFLFVIIFDKTCHTVAMMLIANSCLAKLIFSIDLLSASIFSIENDLKEIEYEDSFCIFRCYMGYAACSVVNYSYLLQGIYRYVTVIYPTRLFWRSGKIQMLLICITWIIGFSYSIVFIFTNEIIYNVDNQICQLPLRLSFSIIFAAHFIYIIPILLIMFIYFKLVRYVHRMSKRVTPVNALYRAQRELKMLRRTIILVMILITIGFPNALFMFMSFFNSPPKYYLRIAFLFFDIPLLLVIIALFQFTDPLKTSLIKRIKRRANIVVVVVR
jgi:hypothetical protein